MIAIALLFSNPSANAQSMSIVSEPGQLVDVARKPPIAAPAGDPCADRPEACQRARQKLSTGLMNLRQAGDNGQSPGGGAPPGDTPPVGAVGAPAAYGGLREAAAPAADTLRFGLIAPMSGANKDFGAELKLGAETAFAAVNEAGGIGGRALKIVPADDGYDPTRTPDIAKALVEKNNVFGFLSNFGTPTAASILPYVLEHRLIFFGAFSGAGVLRREPPDRYVFNYRASYAEETGAAARYLVKVRHLAPSQIAVFAQDDAFGEAGFAGVQKEMRVLDPNGDGAILHMRYTRNTIDVASAIDDLRKYHATTITKKLRHPGIKAVIMVATYRAAAKFVEKARELFPDLILTDVSAVGSNNFAEELKLLGPRYANGIIVTQVVPDPEGYSSIAMEFKDAMARYFPTEHVDYVSFESYLNAKVLIEGLKKAGAAGDADKVVAGLESIHGLDFGLGPTINYGASEHQAVHKVWGTQIDENGHFKSIDLE